MHDVDLFDDRGAVIRDGHLVRAVHDQFVHASRTERGSNGISNSLTRIDIADQLAAAFLTFGALGQENDRTSLRCRFRWVKKLGGRDGD